MMYGIMGASGSVGKPSCSRPVNRLSKSRYPQRQLIEVHANDEKTIEPAQKT